jgi:tetratricopeptide (TPR) repeat protein
VSTLRSILSLRQHLGLLTVLLWAIVLRTVHLYGFFTNSPFATTLVSDAHIFESWAARIASGDWVGDPQLFVLPPLYPYLVGIIYAIVGRAPSLIIVIQSILGVVAAGLIWRMARARFGETAAIVSGVLFGSSGTVLFYESMLVGTSTAVFLMVSALFYLDRCRSAAKCRYLALTGVCFGLLAILRPNVIVVLPVAAGIVLWPVRAERRRLLQTFACFGLAALLPLCGLLVRNGWMAGEWTPLSSHGGINFYMGNHAGAPGWFDPPPGMPANITPLAPEGNLTGPRVLAEAEVGRHLTDREVSDFWFYKGLTFVVSSPGEALGVFLRKTRLFLSAYEVPLNYGFEYHRQYALALNVPFGQLWFLLPLSLIGLVITVTGRRADEWLLILAVYAASVIAFHVSARYRMPVIPILALLAGIPVKWLHEKISLNDWTPVGYGVFLTVVLGGAVLLERSTWHRTETMSMDPFNLGTSHLYAGRPDLALPPLEASRASGGHFAALHYNLGLAYMAVNRGDDALAAYQDAVSIDPNMAAAHTNLGNIHFQAGRYLDAESAYREAITSDSASHNARAALGWVHFTYHRNDSARVSWTHVLSHAPQNASALAGMARLNAPD